MTGRDLLAGLDPRSRVLGAAALIVGLAALDDPVALAAAVALAAGLAVAAGWAWRDLARRLGHVEAIVAALLVAVPFATPGTPVLALGPLSASAEGLALAGILALRIAACALAALALLGALEPARLGQTLARLGAPERLARLFMLTARYAGLIGEELARMRAAMRLRGFEGGLSRHALRSWGHLVGMALVRAADRAERAEEAMRLRLWRGALPMAGPAGFGAADAGFALAVGAALALMLWSAAG
ncbi:MAG: cobalt ECF transporter T component CbiQ [Rubrimonas sp.]|uniref:cobalt ECF transporter T component CbiQ n=1 Tax=Rubrimonas sp. TaxID=2036015 RepID=UPI002FDE22BE